MSYLRREDFEDLSEVLAVFRQIDHTYTRGKYIPPKEPRIRHKPDVRDVGVRAMLRNALKVEIRKHQAADDEIASRKSLAHTRLRTYMLRQAQNATDWEDAA